MKFNQLIELFLSSADSNILPCATENGRTLQLVLNTPNSTHSEKCEDTAEQRRSPLNAAVPVFWRKDRFLFIDWRC